VQIPGNLNSARRRSSSIHSSQMRKVPDAKGVEDA
jgi:hypothetical protein